MANLADMAAKRPARILLCGYPGSGKTGALACLANAGFKLRIIDFDHNLDPLFRYVQPDKLTNIDAVQLEDKLRGGARYIEFVGLPTAFADGLKLMDKWKYKTEAGAEVDLGASAEWGLDTIVVIDSLTSMGEASMNRAMAMGNKTPLNRTQQIWGLAMQDQEKFVQKLTSPRNRFHVIVLSHLKMVGPKDIKADETDANRAVLEKRAELLPTRLYPKALGQELPQVIAAHFPTMLLCENEIRAGRVRHLIRSVPREELDLKIPAADIPNDLEVSDGLLKVFEALTPGTKACLGEGAAEVVLPKPEAQAKE